MSPVETTGPPPEDQDAARAKIASAFASYATLSEDGATVPNVEGGDLLGPCLREAHERHGARYAEREVVAGVDEIVFVDETHAAVWFTIRVDGQPVLRRRRGNAVNIEGRWNMARATFCELMAMAGVACPPESA